MKCGFTAKTAIVTNLFLNLSIMIGVFVGILVGGISPWIMLYASCFIAGAFLYLGMTSMLS